MFNAACFCSIADMAQRRAIVVIELFLPRLRVLRSFSLNSIAPAAK